MVGFWREGGDGREWKRSGAETGWMGVWGKVKGGEGGEGKEVGVLEFGDFRWVWWGCYALNGRFRISRIWKIPPEFTSSAR